MVRVRVEAIDHVELFVPDQRVAAQWYRRVLGLEILARFEHWAEDGPLMISSDGGLTMLALFRGDPPGDRPLAGFRRVAFRLSGQDFGAFVDGLARSIYFRDPWGHRLEVTTYKVDGRPASDG